MGKIREIERLNQSKWLRPVTALGFRKKGLAFARESSLTPEWYVNSACSIKEELWLQGSEMEALLWKWAEKWKRSNAREDWCHSFSLAPHQQRTGRMDAYSILSKMSPFQDKGIQISFCGIPAMIKRVVFIDCCSGMYHVSPIRWRAPQGQELDPAYHFSPTLAHSLAQSKYSTSTIHVNLWAFIS